MRPIHYYNIYNCCSVLPICMQMGTFTEVAHSGIWMHNCAVTSKLEMGSRQAIEIDKYCKSTTWKRGSTIDSNGKILLFHLFPKSPGAHEDFFFQKVTLAECTYVVLIALFLWFNSHYVTSNPFNLDRINLVYGDPNCF